MGEIVKFPKRPKLSFMSEVEWELRGMTLAEVRRLWDTIEGQESDGYTVEELHAELNRSRSRRSGPASERTRNMAERKEIQDLYIRICRDSGFQMDAIRAAHFVVGLLHISALEVWLAMPGLSVMEEIAAGTHACLGKDKG